jgi:hypothetical protein
MSKRSGRGMMASDHHGDGVYMNAFISFLGSKLGLAVTVAAAALGVYLLVTHTGHALGAAPYLLLLACPLMHVFGHHHHHRSGDKSEMHLPVEPH